MLTDLRRHPGFLLRHTLHCEWTADGRDAAKLRMLDLRENSVGHHLCIYSHFFHRRDRSPDHTLLAEEQVPLRHISPTNCLIEEGDYLFAVKRTGLGRGVTRVFNQLRAPDRATNAPPVISGVEATEHKPLTVARLVLIDQRIKCGGAWAPDRKCRADHGGLNLTAVAPCAGRHQRGRHLSSSAGNLPPEECEHDCTKQRERDRMISRPARRRTRLRCQIENRPGQPRARPICRRVVTWLINIIALLTVAGDVRKYQTRINLSEFFKAYFQPDGEFRRIVSDKNVCGSHQAAQRLAPGLVPQVECEALFIAGVEHPTIVVLRDRHPREE